MEYVIRTNGISKHYGVKKAVDDVTITVNEGTICGLIGRNGAGKTTLMRMLAGLIKPTTGSYDINGNRPGAVSGIIEKPSLYLGGTVYDNLVSQSLLLGITPDRSALMALLKIVSLDHVADQVAKTLSLGMKQRLAIAVCLVNKPKVLLLDEPINGLDPQGIVDMRSLFENIASTGVTLLISSHILDELAKVADNYIFMNDGKAVAAIDRDKLEELSKPVTVITCSDNDKASAILSENNYNARVTTDVYVEGKHNATDIILLLANNGIKVSSIRTIGDSLEDIFLSIVGGANNA